MNKVGLNSRETLPKLVSIVISVLIILSSFTLIEVIVDATVKHRPVSGGVNRSFESEANAVPSIPAQSGTWTTFDSSPSGTPSEAHVVASNLTGITIEANFHGFWKANVSINGTAFDSLEMPGAGSLQSPGTPILPCLYKYVEVPHEISISIDILSSSTNSTSEYSIGPAPYEDIPYPVAKSLDDPILTGPQPLNLSLVYTNDTFFPGISTSAEGATNDTSMIMRGHRLLGLSFYPVQYNPVNLTILVYSRIVVKIVYSSPAQIQPIPDRLYSEEFERILSNTVLNYDYGVSPYVARSAAVGSATLAQDSQNDVEYMIITTHDFEFQAGRLAAWKERKGVKSEVYIVNAGDSDQVKTIIREAYENRNRAPTYVLLFGDVDYIPTTYDTLHWSTLFIPGTGHIASDVGYFNIEGYGYLPDMIYGRISVDTEAQAKTIVDKILQYEKDPPTDPSFYNSAMFAGDFYDWNPIDGNEDSSYPFLSALERIRHFMNDWYTIHINYSCKYMHYDRPEDGYYSTSNLHINLADLKFYASPLSWSDLVADSISSEDYPNFEWLMSYDYYYGEFINNPCYRIARENLTRNFNEGRFLVLYYGHGGSKNMVQANYTGYATRDFVEGWQHPFFNTSYFSDLTNGIETPLVISMACSTGWFDGEDDQDHMYVGDELTSFVGNNLFAEYATECLAENITRLEGGGAVAAISSSRPAYAGVSAYLMDGIIQAFWPGFLESTNEPMYDMGAALIYGKLYAKSKWNELAESIPLFGGTLYPPHKSETMFAEYHLFGDPETQLWTKAPSPFDVTYPSGIAKYPTQRVVVTVKNATSGLPVYSARVCLQRESEDENSVYQVGYTDVDGQVIFNVDPQTSPFSNVDPQTTPSYLNITVTKHNFRPHIGKIDVLDLIGPIIVLGLAAALALMVIIIIRKRRH